MVSVDLTGVVGNSPVPAGSYRANLTGVKMKKTAKDDDMMVLELTIADEDSEDFNGRKLFQNLLFGEKSLFQFKNSMIALDADPGDLGGPIPDVEALAKDLIGNAAIVVVKDTGNEKYPTSVSHLKSADFDS